MDWQLAITRNRDALNAIVAAVMVMVGLRAGGTLTTLPRYLYARALLIVRQAESALRRLIVIAALNLALDAIPHHATRLLRWYERRDLALKQNKAHRVSPMRPGRAPAARRKKTHEVEKVLLECHLLAVYAGEQWNSS